MPLQKSPYQPPNPVLDHMFHKDLIICTLPWERKKNFMLLGPPVCKFAPTQYYSTLRHTVFAIFAKIPARRSPLPLLPPGRPGLLSRSPPPHLYPLAIRHLFCSSVLFTAAHVPEPQPTVSAARKNPLRRLFTLYHRLHRLRRLLLCY